MNLIKISIYQQKNRKKAMYIALLFLCFIKRKYLFKVRRFVVRIRMVFSSASM